MTGTARELLEAFESLPEAERHEVAREILRFIAFAQHDPLGDDELVALADEVFLGLEGGDTSR